MVLAPSQRRKPRRSKTLMTMIEAPCRTKIIAAALPCVFDRLSVRCTRLLLVLFAAGGNVEAVAQQDLWSVLRDRPNIVVVMRHTEVGRGNGTVFDATGQCKGELMLTPKGRNEAVKIGRTFAAQGFAPDRLHVVSSAMCRNRDTAMLAFGKAELDPALREFFSGAAGRMNEALDAAEAAVRRLRGPKPVVILTHLPNIDSMTGEQPAHDEVVVTESDASGQLTTLGLLKLY